MASIQLQGKIFLQGTIRAVTGLHIGGNSDDLEIGGIDNPIIRNAFNRKPYIPGSSLRGKMRGLLDRHFNNDLNKRVGREVYVHECDTKNEYDACPVCQVFGVAPIGQLSRETMPTRLIVRDTSLSDDASNKLKKVDTDTLYAEIKTEVAIDRITSAATPRQQERVLADTTFGPFEMIQSFYTQEDRGDLNAQLQNEIEFFDTVLKGMELLADDYLGGSGSRGSGKIAFEDLQLTFKSRKCYEQADCQPIRIAPEAQTIQALRQSNYIEQVLKAIHGG